MTRLRFLHLFLGLALLTLPACGGTSSGGSGNAGFRVTATAPAANAPAVALDTIIEVFLSEAIDPASVTQASIVVGVFGQGPLAGTVSLVDDVEGRTLRWIPASLFAPLTNHNITVAASLRSLSGESLGGTRDFPFRTTVGAGDPRVPEASQMRAALGSLNTGRSSHTATLLLGGNVLIAGGFSAGNAVTDRAETFFATTEAFTNITARLVTGRAAHTATRLEDGRVLLCGGWVQSGVGQIDSTATAEIYNPSNGSFTSVGDMTTDRVDHAANLLPDGRVLITGGSQVRGNFLFDLDSVEIFDPDQGTFSAADETLTHTRATHEGAYTLGNRIIFGGGSDQDFTSERFDFGTSLFTNIGQGVGIQARFGCRVVSFASGGVAIIGGDLSGTIEHVFPITERIQNTGSPLSRPRAFATATRYADDLILVCGGIDFANNGFVEASCDLIIEGGVGGSRTFGTPLRLTTGMARHTATLLLNGRIMFCGGVNEDGQSANKSNAVIFSP